MAIDVSGFVTKEQDFGGLDKAADTLARQNYRRDQLAQQKEGRMAATGKFLQDYLDPKDRLTGTNYDPEIVKQLNDAMIEGADLAKKGASSAEIMMALGPKVGKINEYSQKAKLINQQIKDATGKLKGYKGYNVDAITDEAKKMAFYDADGKLKDISTVDPNTDWVTETVKVRPELVTSGAGLDDFVNRSPMKEYGSEVQTMYAGKKRNVKYDAKSPFWMDVQVDKEGNAITDKSGNPVGLDVVSEEIVGSEGKPIVDPETGKPLKALEKNRYNAIMQHNPDIADFVRGQTNKWFRDAGVKPPEEGTVAWDNKARNVLYDELKTRDRSYFKPRDVETKAPLATRIELGVPVGSKGSGSGDATNVNDIYDRIDKEVTRLKDYGEKKIKPTLLDGDAQGIILDFINKGRKSDDQYSIEDVYLKKTDRGEIVVESAEGNLLTTLPKVGTNLKVQPGVKEKRAVVQQGSSKPKKDPLGLF